MARINGMPDPALDFYIQRVERSRRGEEDVARDQMAFFIAGQEEHQILQAQSPVKFPSGEPVRRRSAVGGAFGLTRFSRGKSIRPAGNASASRSLRPQLVLKICPVICWL